MLQYVLPLLLLAMSTPAMAGEDEDHDRARQLLQTHQVLPLARIAEMIGKQYPGRIIDVELEEEDDRVIYEMKILGDDGEVREIDVDASDGRLLGDPEHH